MLPVARVTDVPLPDLHYEYELLFVEYTALNDSSRFTSCFLFSWTDKATNPANREEDWEFIISFCDQINKELEGPQIAIRLLAHKIQSPQEREALYALSVSLLLLDFEICVSALQMMPP